MVSPSMDMSHLGVMTHDGGVRCTHSIAILGMAYAVGITVHSTATAVVGSAVGTILIYVLCMMLEMSLHPYDVLECEPEIVSG